MDTVTGSGGGMNGQGARDLRGSAVMSPGRVVEDARREFLGRGGVGEGRGSERSIHHCTRETPLTLIVI